MSVIVLGMEMPTTCVDCELYHVGFGYEDDRCEAHKVIFGEEDDWVYETRPNWCPLRPLPEKHGRLVDVDAMERVMSDTVQGDIRGYPYSDTIWDMAFKWLDHQPTIVEAEGD